MKLIFKYDFIKLIINASFRWHGYQSRRKPITNQYLGENQFNAIYAVKQACQQSKAITDSIFIWTLQASI